MKLLRSHILISLSLIAIFLVLSCSDDDTVGPDTTDNFDRSAMLVFWADSIIIPAYEAYDITLDALVSAKDDFLADKTEPHLIQLRNAWLNAYMAWQHVSMFDIGKAEEIGYRNYVNIYPADTTEIKQLATTGNYNLMLPSTFDAQGFPALDYLLFGLPESALLEQDEYNSYLSDLADRLQALNAEVLDDWKNSFRDSFVQNDGASATASTDKMVNDFLFYYEKFFRAGKIGIPAGVFSGTPSSIRVEAPYSGEYSKALFLEAFEAIQKLFNGTSYDQSTEGPSLKQYLDHVSEVNQTNFVADDINEQWQVASTVSAVLMDNFRNQVEIDNSKMLNTYDELQKAVVLLKVDMMQALNIQVDFVDADGD